MGTGMIASGLINWEPHGHASQSNGYVANSCVAVIHKNKNHTYTNTGIYSVTVMGTELRERFRSINEARAAASIAYGKHGAP
jgi:hypothetical protein